MTKQTIDNLNKYFIKSAKLLLKPVIHGQTACTLNILIKKKKHITDNHILFSKTNAIFTHF